MDPLSYDDYTSYSDSSAPRTPSPREEYFRAPTGYKEGAVDESVVVQNLFAPESEDGTDYYSQRQQPNLLQQLYEDSPPPPGAEWQQHPQAQMPRRATYPYVRHEQQRPEPAQYFHQQHQQQLYPEQSYHQAYRCGPYYDAPSPPDDGQGHQGVIVPTQSPYHQHGHHLPPPMPPMPHPPAVYHPSIPVQHTDDAASKETQYLRRRCFNCHTTEPPSWRRSTLNPGKIVCNKCGLYERTHLRPRPLRFDELRAGSKVRKQQGRPSAVASAAGSGGAIGKKAVEAPSGISRRASVSSSNGSSSDWDDNVSVYSSSSGGYSPSLAPSSLSLSRSSSHSPQQHHLGVDYLGSDPTSDESIRLPSAGLTASGRKKSNSLPIYPSAPSWNGNSRLDAVEEPNSLSPPMLASMVKMEA